jgi:hypothetical protein
MYIIFFIYLFAFHFVDVPLLVFPIACYFSAADLPGKTYFLQSR